MALTIEKKNGNILITSRIFGWRETIVTTVEYTMDLMKRRVGNDPWQETDIESRDWARKHYLPKVRG